MASVSSGVPFGCRNEASSFSISAFWAAVRSCFPSSWTRVLDSLQCVAQQAGGAFGGRGGIVEFMRQARGKFSQAGQPVALLLHAGGLADPVGHQAHQPLGQLRHFLHQLREIVPREISGCGDSVSARPVTTDFFIREKGSTPVTSPACERNCKGFAADVAARLKFPFKDHKHRAPRDLPAASSHLPP